MTVPVNQNSVCTLVPNSLSIRWPPLIGSWGYFFLWDLSTGTLLHNFSASYNALKWSWTDHYLLFEDWGKPRYLNTETFEEEYLEDPGDRFKLPQGPLYHSGRNIWIL